MLFVFVRIAFPNNFTSSNTPLNSSFISASKMTEAIPAGRDELACAYAALILHDDGIAVTAEKIKKIVAAAGITNLQPYWPSLFERVLKGKNIDDLILNAGGAGVATVGGGPSPASASAPAPAAKAATDTKKEEGGKKGGEEKKGGGEEKPQKTEEKPKEPEPEEEIALGSFGLFDE